MDLKRISSIIKAKQASDTTSGMNIIRAKQAADTTKMYDRDEMIDTINKITRGEIKPKSATTPVKTASGKKKYVVKDNNGNDIEMTKEEFEGFVKRRGVKIN